MDTLIRLITRILLENIFTLTSHCYCTIYIQGSDAQNLDEFNVNYFTLMK